jgi:hypothetical protein
MEILYTNSKQFSEKELEEIKEKVARDFAKVQRHYPNTTLRVEMKKLEKAGDRCKYSFHLKVESGTSVLLTASHADWHLGTVLHEVLSNLKQEAKHKFEKAKHL